MTSTDNSHRSDQLNGEITAAFATDDRAELPATPRPAEAAIFESQRLPRGSALVVVKRGPNAGSRFVIDRLSLSAGRHPASDIFLDDITVSRRHAEFRCENSEFRIIDVGSLNGTYVNRQPVDTAKLTNGDEIQIGKFRLVFLTSPTTADTDDELRTRQRRRR